MTSRWHFPLVAYFLFSGLAFGQSFEWQAATPESQGMSSARLDALVADLAARRTRALVVVRHDRIVREWYADGVTRETKQGTASLAKAIVGGLSLGVAMSDGKIQLDDPAARYIPAWQGDAQKSKITVRHLGSHTSGLSDSVTKGVQHEQQPGWKGEFWNRQPPPNDPFTIARDQTPLLFAPGLRMEYSNPGIGLLTWCATAAIKDGPNCDIRTLLRERVYRPIGLADADWSLGYGKTFDVDGLPLVGSWGGGSFTPRATARIGRLVLREGDWDGKQILSREAVRAITGDAGLPGHCGMGWWTNAGRRYPWLPADAVWGAGAGDQVLLVVPSLDLVVVRNGGNLATEDEIQAARPKDVLEEFHDPRANILFQPLIEAITDRREAATPYPPSPVIARIDWAPADSIVRKAKGSDNWPLTWGDDDHQYTAYGDGNGFEPRLPEKLGLGLARVAGGPEDFIGTNLRAPAVENKGQGPAGQKASGMLMVDGVLYLLARNAGNSRLAWSADHGANWAWADWKFTTSFGCPTLLNCGKNYAGARDEYVYVYSHDSPSAYEPADRMVLARVPKDKLKERDAYQFFVRLDENKSPIWTDDIAERGAVFEHPGRCYRSAVTYCAGLKRYLWVQILPGTQGERTDTRFAGGFAIFDAPQPWGPWTTAFYTENWDVGPGETASFPVKWMSTDGRTLWLVFSGEDHFSVRKASLTLHGEKQSGAGARP
jgi:CubicO group peptidase (beta-lactamase class C family)